VTRPVRGAVGVEDDGDGRAHQRNVGDLDAPSQKGKKAQACDHFLGGERRCARAVVLEAHILEAHRAGREQRDRGFASEHRIEARHGADFRFDRLANGVGGHQKRQDHESANAGNGQAKDNKCKTFDANGRDHDASFSSARRSTG
jgi:hypothetical protein